jgi:hypothetical protein
MAGATTAKCKEQHANNISACKAWFTYMIGHIITWDQFAASIDDVYYAALDDPTEDLNAVTLWQLITHIALHMHRSANLISITRSPISTK